MKNKVWQTILIVGIIALVVWNLLLLNNVIQTKKLIRELEHLQIEDNPTSNDDNKDKGWCNIQTSPDGRIKYCSDIHGDHFDYCNNIEFYTWVCSTKKDVEENRALYENLCISIRNTCSEGYICEPHVSPISCQKS